MGFANRNSVFLLIGIRNRQQLLSHDKLAIVTIFAILCLFFVAVRNIVGLEFLRNYHTIVLFLPSIIFVLSVLSLASRKKVVIAASVIIFLFYLHTLLLAYSPMAKAGDWKRVAEYIELHEKKTKLFSFSEMRGCYV